MKLLIVKFSQDVDLEDLETSNNYLVVRRENGTTFRLPVPEETIKALVAEVVSSPALPVQEREESPIEVPGPTEFGGGGEDEEPEVARPSLYGDPDESEDHPEPVRPRSGGQVTLTREELMAEGIDPDEQPLVAVPPPRRVLKRAPMPESRRLTLGDDGVPSL